jgi:hypothetical protein
VSVAFDRACAEVEAILAGPVREDIVSAAWSSTLGRALARLRQQFRQHVLSTGARQFDLSEIVPDYDRRTRSEGLHALHDWDGKADAVNEDSIAVDVLSYIIDQRGEDPCNRSVLAMVLDYYLLYVLALVSLRIWDDGHADGNLDRLGQLLDLLQGPRGSGQLFAADGATLILVATSHFELDERGYDLLLSRVRTLGRVHQARVALGHAVSMGCHLRFGFEATYARDTAVMRNDNVADYPWLCFSVATLMREYAAMHEAGTAGDDREAVVEGLLNGLSADARAFVGAPPSSLSSCEAERADFARMFQRHREALLLHFEQYRPSEQVYSPLSLFFNFSHNVLKGMVVDALLRGEPWRLTLNDLLTATSRRGVDAQTKEELARTVMGYARSSPDRIRGRLMPVIVYDPQAGRQAFTVTLRKLRQIE